MDLQGAFTKKSPFAKKKKYAKKSTFREKKVPSHPHMETETNKSKYGFILDVCNINFENKLTICKGQPILQGFWSQELGSKEYCVQHIKLQQVQISGFCTF